MTEAGYWPEHPHPTPFPPFQGSTQMNVFGITDRRHFMVHAAGAAAVTVPGMSFISNLRANAAELKKKGKSLIILWMGGGPTTIDLWDMKPDHANGGSHKPKPTAVSGIRLPNTCRTRQAI